MDSVHALTAWTKSMGTSFPLLSDFYPQGQVVDLYGVRHAAGMPERALFVIDKEGVIRSIEIQHAPVRCQTTRISLTHCANSELMSVSTESLLSSPFHSQC